MVLLIHGSPLAALLTPGPRERGPGAIPGCLYGRLTGQCPIAPERSISFTAESEPSYRLVVFR